MIADRRLRKPSRSPLARSAETLFPSAAPARSEPFVNSEAPHIAVIGGGPAGLRAAEICALGGARVTVFDAKRSVGRKLLVAGYGGLNLTHGEALDDFVTRYSGPDFPTLLFERILRAFPPSELRKWAAGLGIETFEQRTGRVYPREMKAAPLLRRWVARLKSQGVDFEVNTSLNAIEPGPRRPYWSAGFSRPHNPSLTAVDPDSGNPSIPLRVNLTFASSGAPRSFTAAILALGGASWPKTGSDGRWTSLLEPHGIALTAFQPANCGWQADWPADLASLIEGLPLKNIAASAGPVTVEGEVMLTRHGLEGGALYQLGPILRAMPRPTLVLDLKPSLSTESLVRKMESVRRDFLAAAGSRWKLPPHALALLAHRHGPFHSAADLARAVKNLSLPLDGPRPIDEAISSAGGVAWPEIDDQLMLRKLPGVFLAGEMIDWEAPTGGYLIQGCFATATHAARAALARSGIDLPSL